MDIATRIYDSYERKNKTIKKRKYLGGSGIGDCERKLWFQFRQMFTQEFKGRMLRLFQFGHKAEDRFVSELRDIGMLVRDVDKHGKQFEITACNGWFRGHTDGIGEWPNHVDGEFLIEFKTHNDKSFTKLEKEGVQKSKPMHYAQMQVYMTLMNLDKALYFAENKNTSEVYTEWVDVDAGEYKRLEDKMNRIISSNSAPPDDVMPPDLRWTCQWCPALEVCKKRQVPEMGCMSCCNSALGNFGEVFCCFNADSPMLIPSEVVDRGCSSHLYNPTAMPWEYIEAKEREWVHYITDNGLHLYNTAIGAMPPVTQDSVKPWIFTSEEISGKKAK